MAQQSPLPRSPVGDSPVRSFRSMRSSGMASGWGKHDEGVTMNDWMVSSSPQRTPPREGSIPYGSVPRHGHMGGVGYLSGKERDEVEKKEQVQDWVTYNNEYNSPIRETKRRCPTCSTKFDVSHGPKSPNPKEIKHIRSELVSDWVTTGDGGIPRGGRKLYIEHSRWPDGHDGGIVEVPIPHPRHVIHPEHTLMELWPAYKNTHVIRGPPPPEQWAHHAKYF
eukprot:TRINITY_DN12256_c1_g1_i1.p1 TRINITY_DN12256_c1_g1~~TRINITY_DN12256_c1_g1_i1.p1  ORF type:complete len:237 (+),score=40.36 TRINITY_DN12256_c1_g1_i1:48-713(+)